METIQIELTPSLLAMQVLAVTHDAVYLRLPCELQRAIEGGCDCKSCAGAKPDAPRWDTLVVPTVGAKQGDHCYTVHMPDPHGFRECVRLNGQLVA